MLFGKKSANDNMLGEIDIQTMDDDLKQKPTAAPAPVIPQPTRTMPPTPESASIKFEGVQPQMETPPLAKQSFDLGKKTLTEPGESIEKSNPFFEEKRGSTPVYITENTENKPKNGVNFGKIILIVGVVLLIALLAGGGYFFWLKTRQEAVIDVPIILENPVSDLPAEPNPVTQPVPAVPEIPKPKYMNIDVNNLTATQIQEKIMTFLQTTIGSPANTLTEYIVSDLNNNPVGFKTFASKLGLKFSPAVLANLNDSFSFYLYNDNGNVGLGLAIDTLNDVQLKTDLKKEEPNLVKILDPLISLIESTTLNKKVVFTAATYKNIDDNYFNILSKEKLSLDYGVGYKKLVIGTTMLTFRKVVDNVEAIQNSQVTQSANTVVSPTNSDSSVNPPSSTVPEIPAE